jgi:4-amino-4-deoxy-L-arabinose transferase-like glycosyltransferase
VTTATQASGRGPRARSRAVVALALIAGAALIAGFTALRGVDYFDEGLALQAARRVADGQVPYSDFLWPYGPAQPYLLGASFELFGTSLLGWRLLRVVVVALTALVVYVLGRRAAGARLALVAWLVAACALAQPANASPFPVALLLSLLALTAVTGPVVSARAAVLAGVLAGLAAAFRLDFGVYGALACVAALVVGAESAGRGARLAAMTAGAALATAALAYAPFAIATGPGDLYEDLIGRSLREKGYWTLPFPLSYDGGFSAWPPRDLAESAKDVLGFYLPLLVVAGLAVAGATAALRLARERRVQGIWAGLFVIAAGGLAYLLSRTDEFHATPLIVVLAVLLPAGLAWGRGVGGRAGGAVAVAAACLLGLLALYGVANRLSALLVPPETEAIDVPAADGVRAPPAEGRALSRVARVVRRDVPPGEPIYVAPRRSDLVAFSAPLVYVLAERDNPLREDVGLWSPRAAQQRIVRVLSRTRPRLVVRWTDPLSSRREPNPRGRPSGSRVLDEYLARAYRRLERLHHFDLLARR